jgi:2-dehydropantoate 2-reductase
MKIAVIGAGAIGGLVGAKLALAGEQVTFLVRGANLAAIRENGFKLIAHDGTEQVARDVVATDRYDRVGPQDIVILAMKAHQVEAVALDVPKLFGPETVVVTMQNGIPYWYFHRHGGALQGTVVRSVDPEGVVSARIPADRVIGCVVYPASELVAPGVVRHIEGDRFPVGELDGSTTARVQRVAGCFANAGFKAPVLADIRAEIWLKLWGNLSFNPISSLSHSTLVDICQYPLSRELAAAMMREAQAVAHKLGIEFRVTLEKRIAGAEKVGKHKTSMLQDVEAGRAPEIDALVGRSSSLRALTETPTPHIDTVYSLVKLLARTMHDSGATSACTSWLREGMTTRLAPLRAPEGSRRLARSGRALAGVMTTGARRMSHETRHAPATQDLRIGRAQPELFARGRGVAPDAAGRLHAGREARGTRGQHAVRAAWARRSSSRPRARSCCASAGRSLRSSTRPRTRWRSSAASAAGG